MSSSTNSIHRIAQSLILATTVFGAEAKVTPQLELCSLPPIPILLPNKTNDLQEYTTQAGDTVFKIAEKLGLNTEYSTLYRYLQDRHLVSKKALQLGTNIKRADYNLWEKEEAQKFADPKKFFPAEGNIFYYKISKGDVLEKVHQEINKLLSPEDRFTIPELIKFNNFLNLPTAKINPQFRINTGQTILFPHFHSNLEMFTGHPFLSGLTPQSLTLLDQIFKSCLTNNLSLTQLINQSGYQELNCQHKEAIIKIYAELIKVEQIDTLKQHRQLLQIIDADRGVGKLLAGSQSAETLGLLLQMIQQGPIQGLDVKPAKAIGTIIETVAFWITGFNQGHLGTCAPTSTTLELAEHYPLEIIRLTSNLYCKGQANYQDITDSDFPAIVSTTPIIACQAGLKNVPKQDDWMQLLLQTSLMEYANGSAIYDPLTDCHRSADRKYKYGYGATMASMAKILSLITHQKFVVLPAPNTEQEIKALAQVGTKQPVLLSLEWSKLDEKDLQKLVKEKGGSKAIYQTSKGYSMHAVAFHGYDAEHKLVLIINPHPNDYQERDLTNPINHPKELKHFAWAPGIQAIPLDVYLERAQEIARPAEKTEDFNIEWFREVVVTPEHFWIDSTISWENIIKLEKDFR